MNTILNDDERRAAIKSVRFGMFTEPEPDKVARAIEAAVLAKLEQRVPARAMHLGWDTLDNGTIVATYALPVKNRVAPKLYTHPDLPQTDHQRVPEGWKLVPVEPTEKMCNPNDEDDVAAKMAAKYRQEIWSHMLATAPEAPASKCAQCKKEYKHSKSSSGCPKCAPGLSVTEDEFQKPIFTLSQK